MSSSPNCLQKPSLSPPGWSEIQSSWSAAARRPSTAATAQFTRAQPTHIKHSPATRLTSEQAPIRTPTPQDNSTESAPWKTSTPAALSAHKTGSRHSHTWKFRAEGPMKKM